MSDSPEKMSEQASGFEAEPVLSAPLTTGQPKSLFGNAAWNVGWTLWSILVALFMAPFLIRNLGDSRYGLYMLLFVLSGILGVMNLGLAEATLRYVAYYYGRGDLGGINRVYGSSLGVYLLMGLLGWMGVFFGAPAITRVLSIESVDYALAVSVIRLTAFNFGLLFISGVFQAIPQAVRRYDVLTMIRVAQNICYVLGTVAVVLLAKGLYGLVMWQVVTSVLTLVLSVAMAKRLMPGLRLRPDVTRSGLREVFGYGVFAFVNQILAIAGQYTDRLLLGMLTGMSDVAYLSVPQNLNFGVIAVAWGGGQVLFPRFSAMHSREEIRKLWVSSTWMLLCVTVVLFAPAAALIPDFLKLWISPEFAAKSAWIGQLLAASCIVRGAFIPYEHLFRGIGKPQYITRLLVASSATAVVANVILIPRFGLAGAGYAFCMTPVWGLVTVLVTWFRILKLGNAGRFGRTVLLPMMLGFALMAVFSWVRSTFFEQIGWVWLIALGMLFTAVVAAVLMLTEHFLGRTDSHVGVGLQYLRSVFRIGSPRVQAEEA